MRVEWISLTNFRSYPNLEWRPDAGVNILVGPNGAGKTNLLEAIAYLGTLRSFRHVADSALVSDDCDSAVIRSGIVASERERLIEIEIPARGSRRTQVDKQRLRRTADLLGVLRVVAFLPEDLDLIKRGPSYRRDLLDEVAVQLWPAAYVEQSEFDRALRQRNAHLKSGSRDETALDVWDARLAQAGGKVAMRRSRVIEGLVPLLAIAYQQISESSVPTGIRYNASWNVEQFIGGSAEIFTVGMVDSLRDSRRSDRDRRVTTTGPQRDEPIFLLEDADSRTHSSQGEQRTMALALKLAAHRLIAEATDTPPLLILDDVFSELDPRRSQALANSLPDDTQTLISSARPDEVPLGGAVWTVDRGVERRE